MRFSGVPRVKHGERGVEGESAGHENRKGNEQSPRPLIGPPAQDLGSKTMQGLNTFSVGLEIKEGALLGLPSEIVRSVLLIPCSRNRRLWPN